MRYRPLLLLLQHFQLQNSKTGCAITSGHSMLRWHAIIIRMCVHVCTVAVLGIRIEECESSLAILAPLFDDDGGGGAVCLLSRVAH